jgi:SAM-dependent methyltransferase
VTVGYDRYFEAAGHWGRRYEELEAGERARVDTVIDLVPPPVQTILDVGCGDGLVTDRLAAQGFAVTGTDISEEAVRHVSSPTVVARAEALPFGAASFDCVIASDLLEHLPAGAFEAAIAEISRVAADYVIVNAPHREDLALAATRCSGCDTTFHASRHARSITREDVESWFPDFEVQIWRLTGVAAPRRIRTLQRAAQVFGNVYYRPPDAVCPNCGYDVSPPKPNAVIRLLNATAQRILTAARPARASEFVALLARVQTAL